LAFSLLACRKHGYPAWGLALRLPAPRVDSGQLPENKLMDFPGNCKLYHCCRIKIIKRQHAVITSIIGLKVPALLISRKGVKPQRGFFFSAFARILLKSEIEPPKSEILKS
jgi:hypothetical protein